MKNLKKITFLFVSLFIISCSKDDNSQPTIAKEYYPTKITTTNPTNPGSDGSTNIQYDSQNRISQLSYVNVSTTLLFELLYSSSNLVTSIKVTKTTSLSSTINTYNFNYTNSKLSQIIMSNASSVISTNIAYNSTTNTYTSDTGDYFTFDENENLKIFDFIGLGISLNYNGNKGIYRGNNNNLPLILASFYSGLETTLNYSQFFSNKEIISLVFPKGSLNTTVLRNDNTNISQIIYKNSVSGSVSFSSTIDYEQRTVN